MEIRKAFVSQGWRERGTQLKKDSEIVDITISQEKLCFRGKKTLLFKKQTKASCKNI